MADAATQAHITTQNRLRQIVASLVGAAWARLGSYNETDVPSFLAVVLPIVLAGQQQSSTLTAAYLAQKLGVPQVLVNQAQVTGAAVRNGTPPSDVYRRPFVQVWSDLKAGKPLEEAVASGHSRVESAANMDVALSSRATFDTAGQSEAGIYGYRRVAEPGACAFCLAVNGAYVKSASASPLHNYCGCSLEPLTAPHAKAAWLPDGSHVGSDYAIHEHGELGAVLTNPDDHYTTESEALSGVSQ